MDYILEQKGMQFDPDVVDAFENEIEAFKEILDNFQMI